MNLFTLEVLRMLRAPFSWAERFVVRMICLSPAIADRVTLWL